MLQQGMNTLLSTAEIILNAQSGQQIAEELSSLYRKDFGIERIDFYILDYDTGLFHDFVRDWIYIEEKNFKDIVYGVFKVFNEQRDKFIVNGRVSRYDAEKEEIEEIKRVGSKEINLVYLPLYNKERVYGIIEVEYEKLKEGIDIDAEFLNMMKIIVCQISTAIKNYTVINHMAISLNFYDSMKNIAKITESQYELEYIIPQIGEMIDRFVSSHLIYLFLREKEGNYKLYWPSNCNNKEIIAMLEGADSSREVIISADQRIGIFQIKTEEKILGAIVAYSTIGKLANNEIDYISELSKQSGITIQRANTYTEVLKHATQDALTGLNNRRQFEIRLKQETSQSARKNTELCCLMLDIDYFKRINDTYGHAAGDCVLKGVAEIITKAVREYDIVCRYGGEEFFVLLPMTTIDETYIVAERIRRNIQNAKIDIKEAKIKDVLYLQVTVSIGVNKYDRKSSAEEFYQGADKALYISKQNGRNRITINEVK